MSEIKLGNVNSVLINKEYKIDYDKVNTIEDIVKILQALDISIWEGAGGFPDHILPIKHLLLLEVEVDG